MRIKTRALSPCVGICSTGIGDSVCRGCKRYMHEVIDWNSYSAEQQHTIVARLSELIRQVAEPLVDIYDKTALQQGLDYQKIRYDKHAGAYLWLHELLQVGSASLVSLEPFGCRVRPAHKGRSLSDIKQQIDSDFYTLSEVHYERYFKAHHA
ncbi:DUF1289 domain-containing protein [Agaribacterium haliotis]|uniref:DUF1289 domain-containing protein n=1 Tax=Agaribacterium haliotis TaxID=2013869 RepID=UPI000BB53630|nr:DUF1289 domain-containing protein [Agaribacterium haliotis]